MMNKFDRSGVPMLGFKEWVKQKNEASSAVQAKLRIQDWYDAFNTLRQTIQNWLNEDAAGEVKFGGENVTRAEEGLGSYGMQGLKIIIGDQSVSVLPIARNVVGYIPNSDFHAEGRVDITNGLQTYGLYRARENGQDVWYVANEDRTKLVELTKERLEQILMDLMG